MPRGPLRVLLAFCCLGAAFGTAVDASAQDPRATAAQGAAREWLKLTDGDYSKASWQAAGKQFQAALPATKWEEDLRKARVPFGALVTRTLVSTQFRQSLPGARDGQYVMVLFKTSFASKAEAVETVTLEREADGVWRVIGYLIH